MSQKILAIAHIIPYIGREFGGPVIAMAAMVDSLTTEGQKVVVHTVHRQGEGQPVELATKVSVNHYGNSTWGALRHSPELWRNIGQANLSLIHSHGLWTDVHRCAAILAHRKGVPHVLSPCGMLNRDALLRSQWKKRLVGAWFQARALREASCLLANSEKEYGDIRDCGLRNPVAIVPNPVSSPITGQDISSYRNEGQNLFPPRRKTVLFIGRIHPVKGLRRLIDAWSLLTAFHDEWQLVLAGPDEGNYRAEIETLIDTLGYRSTVYLIGALDDAAKWKALGAADLFVMPSDFENFGIAIAEALLAGKPVITTTGTPWQSLSMRGAGWWVAPNPEALQQALAEAMSLDAEKREAMGKRGREIAEAFSPERVAAQLVSLYGWLKNQSEMPSFVRLD